MGTSRRAPRRVVSVVCGVFVVWCLCSSRSVSFAFALLFCIHPTLFLLLCFVLLFAVHTLCSVLFGRCCVIHDRYRNVYIVIICIPQVLSNRLFQHFLPRCMREHSKKARVGLHQLKLDPQVSIFSLAASRYSVLLQRLAVAAVEKYCLNHECGSSINGRIWTLRH